MNDPVNSPLHYTQGSVECIDAIKSALGLKGYQAFLTGTCIKYLWRYEHKGNPIEDLKKAKFYLCRLIDEKEGCISIRLGEKNSQASNKTKG